MDIITKRGIFNEINDPLFAHWLNLAFCRKRNSFNIDIHGAARNFDAEVKILLENFSAESKKKIGQRLIELFGLFENDIIELDRKRFMLTRFDEITLNDTNGASLVSARRMQKLWLCGIADVFIDEAKVGNFISKTKKKECKKKILIALGGIEVNARLKALEENIWIWDQQMLNALFSLFEKPRFIK
jgi:hypothetical protein